MKMSIGKRNALIFNWENYNKYSIAALTGAIEVDSVFAYFDVYFVRSNGIVEKILAIHSYYEKIVIAFSFHTHNIIQIATVIKNLRQKLIEFDICNTLLIAGGTHPSGDPISTLKLGFDVVLTGEGEEIFPVFLQCISHNLDYSGLRGIVTFDLNHNVIVNRKPHFVAIDNFPPFAELHHKFSAIEITRGCSCRCKFCQVPFLMGGRMRHRSIETIVHYVTILNKHHRKDVRFITPNAFGYGSCDGTTPNVEAIEQLLRKIGEIAGKEHVFFGSFPSEVRPESVAENTIALVKKYTANNNLIMGAQTGSQRLLDFLHRGHTVEEIIRATRQIIKAGLLVYVDFIFGMPGETEDDRELSYKMIKELIELGAKIHSHAFMPLAGTPFYQAKPGKIDNQLRLMLERYASQGCNTGSWFNQAKIAKETNNFLKKLRLPVKPK